LTAFEDFGENIKSARNLIAIYDKTARTAGLLTEDRKELLRSAVVFSLSALDAYFHQKIEDAIVPILNADIEKMPGPLGNMAMPVLEVERMLRYYNRPHEKIKAVLKDRLYTLSYMKPDKVLDAVKLLGVEDFFSKVGEEIDLEEDTIRSRLSRWAERRNQIAHEHDRIGRRRGGGRRRDIARADAESCADFIERFVNGAETVLSSEL